MSGNDPQDRTEESDGAERFFSVKQSDKKESVHSESVAASDDSDDQDHRTCLTLRALQYILPCLRNKGVWEPSQGDVFKSHDAEEAKYPRTLRILESRTFDAIFVTSCFLSIYLFLFSEGFLLESRLLWGIIHLVNAIYALGLFSQWLQVLIKSKYAKTNHGYTTRDILYTLISVFPADLIVLVIYTLNDEDDNEDNEAANPIEHWMITVSRLNYFLRIRSIMQYFTKWENHLVVGDFTMFIIRTFVYTTFMIHMFACVWHRLACRSFRLKHFLMTPDEATTDVCEPDSWLGTLKLNYPDPLLEHPRMPVLLTHYLVSVYWTIITTFRLGASDIDTTLKQNSEVAFVTFTEITAWIFVLVAINGTLASLFIEKDAEKEHFLTRCFAIRHYLKFTEVVRSVQEEVLRFYAYLWKKSKGIIKIDLIDVMPHAMKAAVFYDVNKFVMDQLPMLKGLDTPFLMSLSVHTTHKFYLSGETLFRKGDTAAAMYYLVKGHLEIMSEDEKHAMATIRSGSIIGEIHLLQPYPHIATVQCGTDCDVLVLSRKHFRRVVNVYPQYIPVLEQRLESRLEQSGLLLALCEKHNTYQKAFKILREAERRTQLSDLTVGSENDYQRNEMGGHSFENVTKILAGSAYESKPSRNSEDDYDGLEIPLEFQLAGHGQGQPTSKDRAEKKGYEEKLAAAHLALETDVARAGSLATDLNIPRPPVIVTAPDSSIHVTLGFHQDMDTVNIFVRLFKQMKEPTKGAKDFWWKFLVCFFIMSVCWYYPYQFAFRGDEILSDYIFHFVDFIFALDFVYDMIQVVVTPPKTYENFKEIMLYRMKTVYFYVRLISFTPLEYIIATSAGIDTDPTPGMSASFYLFKLNRLLLIHLVSPFLSTLEVRLSIRPVVMGLIKLAMGVCYVAHVFAVAYKFVLRDVNKKNTDSYVQSFYRALEVTTSTGYGDIRSTTNLELVVEVIGLMVGVTVLIYLQAKVTAMLVNSERQRVSFQQTYYALKDFMKQRKFPKQLKARVSEYYNLQWEAHEGTLVPNDKQTIWDAPKALISKVSDSVGRKYILRIPLFMHIPAFLLTEFCLALNHYIVPPGEVLLYPDELARDLYIIAKGYVQVIHKNRKIGVFTEGRYFGLNGLLLGTNPNFMFRSITHCQILCLTYENFQRVANSNAYFLQEYMLLKEMKGEEEEKDGPPVIDDASLLAPPGAVPKPSSRASRSSSRRKSSVSMNSSRKSFDMIYPPQVFMDRLVEESPPFDDLDTLEDVYVPKKGIRYIRSCFRQSPKERLSGFYVLPNGMFLKCWLVFRITAAVLATIFAACQLTLPIPPDTAFLCTLLFDMVSWIDMCISIRTAFLGEKNQLVTASGPMAIHYLKGNFLFDVLGCLPVDYVLFFMYRPYKDFDGKYHIVALLRLNRTLQVGNLFMASSVMEKTLFRSLSFIMLVEMVPFMFVFINVTTFISILAVCGYTITGDPALCDNPEGWILHGLRNMNYVSRVNQLLFDISGSYIVGLYWVTQNIFNIGFGDIEIGPDRTNQIVTILVTFSGIMVATYVAGKLTSCIVGEDPAKISLQEKMTVMHEHLELHRVSKGSRRRVRDVYLNAWNKTHGVSPHTLFMAVPPTLKTDVMKHLYGAALSESPLFENLDGPGLRMLASSLTEVYYTEGEFLMRFGDLCDDVFYIAHGAIVCYNVRGDIMSQLGKGSLIGEICPFFHSHRLYTAVAVKDVTTFVFKKDVFMNFLEQYPDLRAVIEACSMKHYREAMAGTKKTGSSDYDVLLTFQNEKEGQGELPKVQISTHKASEESHKSKHSGSFTVVDQHDITRKVLEEDIMKSPEELSKPNVERWWYVFVTFGRIARDEMGLIHIHQELEKCTIFNFAIHPISTVCGWVSFCLIVTAFSCGITAYEIAFASRRRPTETTTLTCIRYFLEAFFVIRIIGNFHLGYNDDDTGSLITDVKHIARRYAYKIDGLWLDFVTTFPFYMAEYFVPGLRGEYIRSVQLLRVILFVRYLKETDSSLKLKGCRIKVLKITILLCFIFHFWACAFYAIACSDSCTTGSWMQDVLNGLGYTYNTQNSDDAVSTTSRYLLSLYYVTNALTYTGLSEITGHTKSELLLTIAMVFGTVFVIGYLVGEMVQCLSSLVATKIHYQHKLNVLENHLATLGISSMKIEEVRHYFKLLWCRCRGMMFYDLMEEIPYTLRADVAMEIYGPNLKCSRILGKLDENLMRQLSEKIRHEIYFPGSHLVRAGDVCSAMYFIKRGEIVILDGNSNLELCVEILYENECFGEVKILLPREQYRFSYVARLESEVGVLYKEDLEAVLKNHPKIFDELKEKAARVKTRRQSLKDEDEREKAAHGAVSYLSIRSAVSQHSKGRKDSNIKQ